MKPAPLTDLDGEAVAVTADDDGQSKPAQTQAAGTPQPASSGPWQWLSLALATGWLITLAVLWRTRQRKPAGGTGENKTEKFKQVVRELQKACAQNDVTAAKVNLLKWGRLVWPDKTPASIGEIGRRMGAPMSRQIRLMNDALYSRQQGDWDGRGFWQVFKQELNGVGKNRKPVTGDLEPLYRL